MLARSRGRDGLMLCPFCRGYARAYWHADGRGWAARVGCAKCGASTAERSSANLELAVDKASAAWNLRNGVDWE